MKLTTKNRPVLFRLILLGALTGTLGWALLEIIFTLMGIHLSLEIGPVGFDLHAIAVWIRINPGTILGGIGGLFLFKTI